MSWNRMGLTLSILMWVIKPYVSKQRSERRDKIAVLLSTCLMVNEIWRIDPENYNGLFGNEKRVVKNK